MRPGRGQPLVKATSSRVLTCCLISLSLNPSPRLSSPIPSNCNEMENRVLWDCDSALYDSFELKSFNRHLDAAIGSRSLSMPTLSDPAPKKQSKVARSLAKILRAVFRRKIPSGLPFQGEWQVEYGFYCAYPKSNSLTTIPEVSEKALESPEFDSVVRRSVSERFTSATGGFLKTPAL